MKKVIFIMVVLFSTISFSQIKNSFDIRYQTTVRGDMTMISNNIVSQHVSNPYNSLSTSNDNINMQYVDIDGDATTYNSSSAKLNIDNIFCSKVVYAGLYWSATYRYEVGNNPASGRFQDWNTVKFKVPGENYQTITANEVLYDGFSDVDQTNVLHGPYSCYADVTSLVQPLTNPNGDYYVGNIRVSKNGIGTYAINGGVAGGWTLVVVYENVTLPSKYITTFDGHAVISSNMATPLDIPVNGFQTLPAPLPVNARMGLITLEGDYTLTGDQLLIKANSSSAFTALSNAGLSSSNNNFFNSSITRDGIALNATTDRTPNSKNTLGWDSHLNKINNPLNSIMPNDETGVTLRAKTIQDKYDIFFASFDVESIEPRIPLINTIEDFSGNNLDGQPLELGQEFLYSLCFQNTGNDNAQNFVISNQLPTNIIFPVDGTIMVGDDIIMPFGVSYTFNNTTNQLTFTVNNNLVEKNDPQYCIKIKVKAPIDCFDVIDACANIFTNQAFVSYQGEQNSQIITDNPSFNGYDLCTNVTPGATNFLIDIDLCSFVSEEVFCGNPIALTAANGYSDYIWTYDHDNNVATLPISVPEGNTQSITVSNIGTYYVNMITPAPCASVTKTFNVIDCTFANENFTFNNFKSFPNPVKNLLTISNASPIETIEISSILGQKMISKKINDIQTEIDLSQLSNGIYFVKVKSQGNDKTIKIVKE